MKYLLLFMTNPIYKLYGQVNCLSPGQRCTPQVVLCNLYCDCWERWNEKIETAMAFYPLLIFYSGFFVYSSSAQTGLWDERYFDTSVIDYSGRERQLIRRKLDLPVPVVCISDAIPFLVLFVREWLCLSCVPLSAGIKLIYPRDQPSFILLCMLWHF